MISIKSFVSSYELSEELDTYKIPIVVYDGSFIYEKKEDISSQNEILYVVVDVGNNQLTGIAINSDKIYPKIFKEGEFFKAYTSAEIGELLPIDYTLPIRLEEGWAFVGADGNIYTDYYYENETEARMMYLLYFLKHKVLSLDDLIGNKDDENVQSK